MCKSMGRLCSLLLVLVVVVRIDALPVSSSYLENDDYDDSFEDDYDVVFDQRQNGTANVHVSVDGVLLALPAPEIPTSASLAGATLLDLFASQLAAGGELEDDVSDELYTGSSEVGSAGANTSSTTSSSSSSSSTSTTTTTTTAAPAPAPAIGGLSNDFAFETLPVSLLGQGLNFLFNTRPGEVPFRVNPGAAPANQAIPLLITKVEKAPARDDVGDSLEESREVAEPQRVSQDLSGKKKRKHKRKYKVRLASVLRPLLKRTVRVQ
uniref:DUF4794 domain-containing protein n=1 Tax=Anopheles atroparvus TaxID=41427 RepID=A0AAG5D8Y4_ANOAO